MSLKHQNRKLRHSIALQFFKECRKRKWTDADLAEHSHLKLNAVKRILFKQADMPPNVYIRLADTLRKTIKISFENKPIKEN